MNKAMAPRIDYPTVAPEFYKALNGAHAALLRTGFDKKLVDLVFQRISQINGCAFCVEQHGRDLRAAGETSERLDSIAAWHESPYFTEREKAALAWAESLTHVADTHAPDDVYEEVRKHFSEVETANLTYAIALMNAYNRVAVGLRREPPKIMRRLVRPVPPI
jgi:AhpD family alkylhydroperoxidase